MSNIVSKNFGFSTPFLRGYNCLKLPVVDDAGNPVWPEMFGTDRIDALRDAVGPRQFSAQMMLEYISPQRVRLDPGALGIYEDEFDMRTARIGEYSITGACAYWDPSGGRRKSDGSVCVILYRDDKNRRAFIHDVVYLTVDDDDLHPLARQCDMVLDFIRRRGMRRIAIETNGIGGGLPEIMRDVAARRGENICVQKISNSRAKDDRILDAIEPMLASGRLHAHARVGRTPLFSEMMGWSPLGGGMHVHDDGLDAVAGAILTTPVAVRPLGAVGHTFSANTNFKV